MKPQTEAQASIQRRNYRRGEGTGRNHSSMPFDTAEHGLLDNLKHVRQSAPTGTAVL